MGQQAGDVGGGRGLGPRQAHPGPEGADHSGDPDHPGGPVWCEAVALLVCYDPATGASRPMDDAFRAAVEGLEGATG